MFDADRLEADGEAVSTEWRNGSYERDFSVRVTRRSDHKRVDLVIEEESRLYALILFSIKSDSFIFTHYTFIRK